MYSEAYDPPTFLFKCNISKYYILNPYSLQKWEFGVSLIQFTEEHPALCCVTSMWHVDMDYFHAWLYITIMFNIFIFCLAHVIQVNLF